MLVPRGTRNGYATDAHVYKYNIVFYVSYIGITTRVYIIYVRYISVNAYRVIFFNKAEQTL